jgi:glycosyltransferase involved in cell wall biosynthesis
MVLVSAVIPTRGRPEFLLRAVRSVLGQTLRKIEAVVVIDGQDPATERAVKMLAREDGRVRVIALPTSIGGSAARNRGVDEASGEWIAFLDDDDEWMPGKLAIRGNAA